MLPVSARFWCVADTAMPLGTHIPFAPCYPWCVRGGQGKPGGNCMRTVMGQGVDFMAGTHKWPGKAPNQEQMESAMAQLGETGLGDF